MNIADTSGIISSFLVAGYNVSEEGKTERWDKLISLRPEGGFPMYLDGYAQGLTLEKYYALEIDDLSINGKQIICSGTALDQILDAVNAGVNLYCTSEKSTGITSKAKLDLRESISMWNLFYLVLVRMLMVQNGVAA